jgi:hypothetical protein
MYNIDGNENNNENDTDRFIIYGWIESNLELVISKEWLNQKKINCYLTKNYHNIYVPVYGIKCSFDMKTNNYDINDNLLNTVRNAYKDFAIFCNNYNLDVPFLDIHLVKHFDINKYDMRFTEYYPID